MANKGVLVDAGPMVAILSAHDQYHALCSAEAASLRGPFFTTWPVVTEAAYLLRTQPRAVEKLLGRIRNSKLQLAPLVAADADGIAAVLAEYADQDFDLADATLMYLARRENIDRVFTIDQRHFSVFRISKGQSLTLHPSSIS